MTSFMRVACVQVTGGSNIDMNIRTVGEYVRRAADQGAEFVVTPENTCHMVFPFTRKSETSPTEKDHPAIPYFSDLAKELKINLLVGSISIKTDNNKLMNRSYLFSPDGIIKAKYDKIHLFDANISQNEFYRESDVFECGEEVVTSQINDDFTVGMSICYDLRFAYLYRDLAKAGANIMCIPSAFTVPTGKAHWEILVRARAIETGSFVVAAGQVGEHSGGRKTYGHSMIVSPWGKILAQKDVGEGIIIADMDSSDIDRARNAIPSLKHDRLYTMHDD